MERFGPKKPNQFLYSLVVFLRPFRLDYIQRRFIKSRTCESESSERFDVICPQCLSTSKGVSIL